LRNVDVRKITREWGREIEPGLGKPTGCLTSANGTVSQSVPSHTRKVAGSNPAGGTRVYAGKMAFPDLAGGAWLSRGYLVSAIQANCRLLSKSISVWLGRGFRFLGRKHRVLDLPLLHASLTRYWTPLTESAPAIATNSPSLARDLAFSAAMAFSVP